MKRIVIESPLGGDFKRNKRYALWCAYHCYTRGEAAYASHLIYPQFLDDQNEEHREFGITAGYAWAVSGDLFAFYVDLGLSPGMLRAKERWKDQDTEERHLPTEMWEAFERGELPNFTKGFDA